VGSVLKDFSIQAASEGTEALGTVTVRIQPHVDPTDFWIVADNDSGTPATASLVDAVEDPQAMSLGQAPQMKLNPHIKIVNAQKNQVDILLLPTSSSSFLSLLALSLSLPTPSPRLPSASTLARGRM
jgi:hypothetical protein